MPIWVIQISDRLPTPRGTHSRKYLPSICIHIPYVNHLHSFSPPWWKENAQLQHAKGTLRFLFLFSFFFFCFFIFFLFFFSLSPFGGQGDYGWEFAPYFLFLFFFFLFSFHLGIPFFCFFNSLAPYGGNEKLLKPRPGPHFLACIHNLAPNLAMSALSGWMIWKAPLGSWLGKANLRRFSR